VHIGIFADIATVHAQGHYARAQWPGARANGRSLRCVSDGLAAVLAVADDARQGLMGTLGQRVSVGQNPLAARDRIPE